MSLMPNKTTSGGSMWTPQAKGDTSKIWKGGFSNSGSASKQGGFMNKNPGKDEQRNSRKSGGCTFCG